MKQVFIFLKPLQVSFYVKTFPLLGWLCVIYFKNLHVAHNILVEGVLGLDANPPNNIRKTTHPTSIGLQYLTQTFHHCYPHSYLTFNRHLNRLNTRHFITSIQRRWKDSISENIRVKNTPKTTDNQTLWTPSVAWTGQGGTTDSIGSGVGIDMKHTQYFVKR